MGDAPNNGKRRKTKKRAKAQKGTRSETVSVRLDPKLRYLADLAARKQRRTLSSFIEWALEGALGRVIIQEREKGPNESVADLAEVLWDVDDADRFVKLAFGFPELLDHSEQVLWKVIKNHGAFWDGGKVTADGSYAYKWTREAINYRRLRTYWDTLNSVAAGDAEESELPHWSQFHEAAQPSADAPPPDDDIPF